jgi:tRNA dimethylallyltransferase
MYENPFHRAIYLTGPTASGKTAVGVALARRFNAEILALDSATLYRGMDIGTAKPSLAERGGIPHHLIDVIDHWDSASVAEYREWAGRAVSEVEGRGKRVLFVGGTALYLKVLLRGLFRGPGADLALRARLEQEADALGEAALHERLAVLDQRAAARLHRHDRRRVIRALEVIELAGSALSVLQAEHDQPAPPGVPVIALGVPRACLNDRINRRVLGFFDRGLVDEVVGLQGGVRPLSAAAASAIGYREVIEMLGGRETLARTIERVQTRSRQFAKRQATWFRGLKEVRTVLVPPDEDAEATAARVAARIESGIFEDPAS